MRPGYIRLNVFCCFTVCGLLFLAYIFVTISRHGSMEAQLRTIPDRSRKVRLSMVPHGSLKRKIQQGLPQDNRSTEAQEQTKALLFANRMNQCRVLQGVGMTYDWSDTEDGFRVDPTGARPPEDVSPCRVQDVVLVLVGVVPCQDTFQILPAVLDCVSLRVACPIKHPARHAYQTALPMP